jgi:hypothetical protein
VSVESSKDVNLGAHQARGVAGEVGDFVSLDGRLGEGLGFSIVVDDFIKALCVSLLSSNEDDDLSEYGGCMLESLRG